MKVGSNWHDKACASTRLRNTFGPQDAEQEHEARIGHQDPVVEAAPEQTDRNFLSA